MKKIIITSLILLFVSVSVAYAQPAYSFMDRLMDKLIDRIINDGDLQFGGGVLKLLPMWSSFLNGQAIYPRQETDVVVIGDASTTSPSTILEVKGLTHFRGGFSASSTSTSTPTFHTKELCIDNDCQTAWPSGGASAWEHIFTGAITPTTTSAGIFVTASSTIQSSLRVDGNATTTGNFATDWITINNTAEPALSISMTGITGTDNQAIDIIGGEILNASEDWTGIRVKPDDLDPDGANTRIRGLALNLSDVDTTNIPDSLIGLRIKMPCCLSGDAREATDAIYIAEGDIDHNFTAGTAAGSIFTAYDMVINTEHLHANSDIHAFDIITTNGVPAGSIAAIGTHTYIDPIHQHIGTYTSPSQTEYAGEKTGGGATWADGIDGSEIFVQNSDEVYIGSTAQFAEIQAIMTTDATRSVAPTFWYNTAADAWTQFYPSDTTDGFQQSGLIHWTLSSISSLWTNDGDPGGANASAGYWIKIIRTSAPDPGTPTPTTAKTGTTVLYDWDKDGDLKIRNATTTGNLIVGDSVWDAPTSTLTVDGSIYATGNATTSGSLDVSDNIYLKDDQNIYFDTANTYGIRYGSAHGSLVFPSDYAVEGSLDIYANSGADGSGNWEPYFTLNNTGSVSIGNTAQGTAGNKYFRVEMTDGMRLATGDQNAIILADNIASSNKTFQFPNLSGVLALATSSQNVIFGNATSTATTTARGLKVENLLNCDTIDTNAEGHFVCGSDDGAGGGISDINSSQFGQLADVSTTTLVYGSIPIWDTSNWTSSSTWSLFEAEWINYTNASSTIATAADITADIATHLAVVADTNTTGHLNDTDWDTFNNKWDGLTDMVLTDNYIYVGDASNDPVGVAMSNDCAIASDGTITCDHDALDNFVANEHLDWTSDLGATNIHAGNYTDTDTTYLGGTNLTLVDTTFNVDDKFLKNDVDDTTAFGITMGSATTTNHLMADSTLYVRDSKVGIGTANSTSTLQVSGGDVHFQGTGGSQGLFWDESSAELGIGVTNPLARLHVNYPATGNIIFQAGTGDGDADMQVKYGYNGYGWYYEYEGSGLGDNNEWQLWSEGAGGVDMQVYGIKQSGIITFHKGVNLSGNATSTYFHIANDLTVLGNVSLPNNSITDLMVADVFLHDGASDTMTGTLTCDGLTMGANENITLGAQTLDHDGTDFVFNDTIAVSNDSISAAELNEGDTFTWTGTTHDFSGTTNLKIPAVADAAGEIGIDTTNDDQFIYYGDVANVITAFNEKCFTIASTTFKNFDEIPLWTPHRAITITDAYCTAIGGTSVATVIEDTGNNGLESITCDTNGQADDGSITNGAFIANELMRVDFGTVTGDVNWLNYCITYTITAD